MLQEEARELGIYDINEFMKGTVWPFVKQGGDLALVGFHYFDNFIPTNVKHEDIEASVFPEGYMWEDNDPKHQQNREVCTHGATLLDKEQLKPAECEVSPERHSVSLTLHKPLQHGAILQTSPLPPPHHS